MGASKLGVSLNTIIQLIFAVSDTLVEMLRISQLSLKPIVCLLCLQFCGFDVSLLHAQALVSKLPILIIGLDEQQVPAEDKMLTTLRIASSSDGASNSSDGPFDHYDGYAGIELRGSTSLFFPKHGYSFELRDQTGEDLDFPLLGMPEEEDWVLHGPYSDKTLLRNAFTYSIAQSTSTWAPRSRFCEVFFNDDYRGVYLLVERIKRDKNRLDLAKITQVDNADIQLTGGYILKVDKTTAETPGVDFSFTLPNVDQDHGVTTQLIYHDPKPELITAEQKTYIKAWMQDFEGRLAGRDFADDRFGYRSLIDMNSWIDFFLINEITRNVDGYRLSTYLHKKRDDKGGKLHMGPIWDFNLGLGNADYCDGGRTSGWAFEFNEVCPDDSYQVPFHYQRLLQDSLFSTALVERWKDFRSNEWSDENILHLYDSLAASLDMASVRNFERWPIVGEYIWPNSFVESDYEDGLGQTRNWLVARLAWLDREIPDLAPEKEIPFFFGLKSSQSALVLEGFKRIDYPIELEIFSTSGQLVYKQRVSAEESTIEFDRNGLVFYQMKTARGDLRTGKLYMY